MRWSSQQLPACCGYCSLHVQLPRGIQVVSRVVKFKAYAEHLLDAFIELRQRYALLAPMLFNEAVAVGRGSGKQARGFQVLRHSLVLSCAQDIAKLTVDNDKRAASLARLVQALAEDELRRELQDQYAEHVVPSIEEESDPEIVEALRRMELAEAVERRAQFDTLYCEAMSLWAKLSTSETLAAFRTIRDKVTAHNEVRHSADKYHFVDIGSLGLTWKDFRETILEMQRLVELMGLLFRNTGFAWDYLDKLLDEAATAFWEVPGP